MTDLQLRALQYIRNTGETATPAIFDDDHEPVGPFLRQELDGLYCYVGDDGALKLTEEGLRAIA